MMHVHNPGDNMLSDHDVELIPFTSNNASTVHNTIQSDNDVELIRQLYEQYPTNGHRKKAGVFLMIADKFGVSRECAYSICHYRRRCKNIC